MSRHIIFCEGLNFALSFGHMYLPRSKVAKSFLVQNVENLFKYLAIKSTSAKKFLDNCVASYLTCFTSLYNPAENFGHYQQSDLQTSLNIFCLQQRAPCRLQKLSLFCFWSKIILLGELDIGLEKIDRCTYT